MPTVEKSVSLKSYNTFAVDVSAHYFAEVCTPEDIRSVLADPRYGQLPRFVLGGGSNTLFTKDFEGLVLHMKGGTIEVTDENDRFYFVKVSAGIVWDDFVRRAIEGGWYGIENLAAVPGTVGGAAVQGFGAYGVGVCLVGMWLSLLLMLIASIPIAVPCACCQPKTATTVIAQVALRRPKRI